MSKVTIFSTGGTNKTIEVNSTTWGDLQKELSNNGVSTSGMKAVHGQTRVTLEHKDAIIPDGDFNLFLLPVKTKSGGILTAAQVEALPYKDLRSELSRLAAEGGESFKAHFNQDKNYTTKTTGDLKSLLISYYAKASTTSGRTQAKAEPAKENTKVSRTVKAEPKQAEKAPVKKDNGVGKVVGSVGQAKSSVPAKTQGEDTGLNEEIDNMVNVVKGFSVNSALKDQAIRALSALKAGGAIQTDTKKLESEARALAAGFSDLKSF